jgi:serine/threonine-protein kinase
MSNTELPPSADQLLRSTADGSSSILGDFRLLRALGEGTTGRVYLCEQLSLHRQVAVKVLRHDLVANPVALKRFRAEAEAVARIPHANIVQIYTVGDIDGLHFMALEYIDGKDLRDTMSRMGRIEVKAALSILRQVAAALQRAHEGGIIHRDIKPGNILVTRRGEVKVTDFGLSRCLVAEETTTVLTQAGELLGTPLYMSPEQVRGQVVGPRSDIYSLGATAYHLLSGRPPFVGENSLDVAFQHVQAQPTPLHALRPDLPLAVCTLVHRMMAKDPDQRYPTGQTLLKDLKFLGKAPVKTQLQPTPARGRRRMLVGVGLLFLAGLTAAVSVAQWRIAAPAAAASGAAPVAAAVLDSSRAEETSQRRVLPSLPAPSGPDRAVLLKTMVDKDFDPEDAEAFRQHLDQTVQLGLLYLKRRHLKEAQTYFDEMQACPPHGLKAYVAFGRIGLGAVQALRNRPRESNDWFLAVERLKPPPAVLKKIPPQVELRQLALNKTAREYPEVFLLRVPAVRKLVTDALERNADSMGPLPEPLERLRTP